MATLKELAAHVAELEARTIALEGITAQLIPRAAAPAKGTGIKDAVTFASTKEAMAAGKTAAIAGHKVRVSGNTMYYY